MKHFFCELESQTSVKSILNGALMSNMKTSTTPRQKFHIDRKFGTNFEFILGDWNHVLDYL